MPAIPAQEHSIEDHVDHDGGKEQLAHLSAWLLAEDLGAEDLTAAQVERFLAVRARGGHGAPSGSGLLPMLEILHSRGLLTPAPPPAPMSVDEELLAAFMSYVRGRARAGRGDGDHLREPGSAFLG